MDTDGSEKEGFSQPSLATFLAHPILATPKSTCAFFQNVDKTLKDRKVLLHKQQQEAQFQTEEGPQKTNQETRKENACQKADKQHPKQKPKDSKNSECMCKICTFKKRLDEKAQSQKILASDGNWKQVIDDKHNTEHYTYLKTNYLNGTSKNSRSYNIFSVRDLIEVIRHKYEHFRDFPPEVKSSLNWNSGGDGQCEIDQGCAQYWQTLFPKLLAFVWVEMLEFRESLGDYYPEIESQVNIPMCPTTFFFRLDDLLKKDLKNGGAAEIYTLGSEGKVQRLEFRTLNTSWSNILPAGCRAKIIQIVGNKVWIHWMLARLKSVEHFCDETLPQDIQNTTIFILKRTREFEKVMTDIPVLDNSFDIRFSNVIIISSKLDKEQKGQIASMFDKNYTHFPIRWKDLDLTESEIEQYESKSVKINGNKFTLSQILPTLDSKREKVRSKLSGGILVKFVKDQMPTVFSKCEQLSLPEPYMSRRYKNVSQINLAELLWQSSDEDVFVVSGLQITELKNIIGNVDVAKLNNKELISISLSKFVLVESSSEFDKLCKNFTETSAKSFHFLRHAKGSNFVWRRSFGSNSCILQYFVNHKPSIIPEKEFLDQVLREKIIFLTDPAGHGKTVAIKKIPRSADRTVSLFLRAKEIADEMKSVKLSIENVKEFLVRAFCTTEFETELLQTHLGSVETVIKFLIFLDGYDEVEEEERKVIKELLNFLQTFSCVFICVTTRSYIDQELRQDFLAAFYSMEPLTGEEQKRYFITHWNNYLQRLKKPPIQHTELEKFAHKCVVWKDRFARSNSQTRDPSVIVPSTKLLGTPLLCYIMAQVLEDKLEKNEFEVNLQFNINELYTEFCTRKFQVYLRHKEGTTINFQTTTGKALLAYLRNLHIYYALRLVSADAANWFEQKLVLKSNTESDRYVLNVGLIESLHPIRFAHTTYVEHLLSWFFAQVVDDKIMSINIYDPTFQHILWDRLLYNGYITRRFSHPLLVEFFHCMLPSIEISEKLLTIANDLFPRPRLQSFPLRLLRNIYFIDHVQCATYEKIFHLALKCPVTLGRLFVYAICFEHFDFCKHVLELDMSNFLPEAIMFEPDSKVHFTGENNLNILHCFCLHFSHFYNERGLEEGNLSVEKMKDLLSYIIRVKQITGFVNEKNSLGQSPLQYLIHEACFSHSKLYDWIIFLVEKLNADIKVVDNHNNTLLHSLAKSIIWHGRHDIFNIFQTHINDGHRRLWDYFLSKKCNRFATNVDGETPYHIIFKGAYTENIKMILADLAQEDVTFIENTSNIGLLSQVFSGYHQQPDASEPGGTSSTQKKSKFRRVCVNYQGQCTLQMMEYLLSLGCNINMGDKQGSTPLQLAVKNRRLDIVKALLKDNASVETLDNKNRSILYYIALSESREIYDVVISKIPKLDDELLKFSIKATATLLLYEIDEKFGTTYKRKKAILRRAELINLFWFDQDVPKIEALIEKKFDEILKSEDLYRVPIVAADILR